MSYAFSTNESQQVCRVMGLPCFGPVDAPGKFHLQSLLNKQTARGNSEKLHVTLMPSQGSR